MPKIHNGLLTASPWETNLLPQGIYTASIQAVDSTGHRSEPIFITASIGEPRGEAFAYSHAHLEGWPGEIKNGVRDNNGNSISGTGSWTWDTYKKDNQYSWADTNHWGGPDAGDLIYTHPVIDLGHSLSWHPGLTGDAENGTLKPEIRTSNDNKTWSKWTVPTAQSEGRYLQFRATVTADPKAKGPQILKQLSFNAFGETLSEVISDADTSTWQGANRGLPKARYWRISVVAHKASRTLDIAQFQIASSVDSADDLARGIIPETSSLRPDDDHVRKNATDGNSATLWASNYDSDPWLIVDLGESKTVGNVFINTGLWGFPDTFEISYSNDKSNWTVAIRDYGQKLPRSKAWRFGKRHKKYIVSATSTPGVRVIPVSRTYSYITSIQVALQSVGAGWTWELLQKHPLPVIAIYDKSGTLKDANVDVIVTGVAA